MTKEQEIILKQITFPHKDYWLTRKDIKITGYNLFGSLSYTITYKNLDFDVYDTYIDNRVYDLYQKKELLECLTYYHVLFDDCTIEVAYDWECIRELEQLDYLTLLKAFKIIDKCGELKIFNNVGRIQIYIHGNDNIDDHVTLDDLDNTFISYFYDLACLIQKRVFYNKITT